MPNSPSAKWATPSLVDALDYLELLADVRPDKFDRAAVRWHGRLELESAVLTIAESQLAPRARRLAGRRHVGRRDPGVACFRRVQPTLVRGFGFS
jgi:hypothetical protein